MKKLISEFFSKEIVKKENRKPVKFKYLIGKHFQNLSGTMIFQVTSVCVMDNDLVVGGLPGFAIKVDDLLDSNQYVEILK